VLAKRYQAEPPRSGKLPAHWLPNRWGQNWPGLVEGVDMDKTFKGKPREFITEQAERFYISLGLPKLPKSFWEKSDLYPADPKSGRKKNSHASAWHIDLRDDVRSLMSIEPNSRWLTTAHDELGHIYYYDYAIGTVIKFRLHDHIARTILKQDPRECNYYGNKQAGEFLRHLLALGATRDWNTVLREATGEGISARALVAYFAPLAGWLQNENQGRDIGLELSSPGHARA